MTNNLKVALVVPDYAHSKEDDRQICLSKLTRACQTGEIELVVFPEHYEYPALARAQEAVDRWASTFRTPVLMGVESDGFQLAIYRNPHPRGNDTHSHRYVKHSTAKRLAYEWPGYRGADDPMFRPICLNGECLGVHICHDMFYGLICARLSAAGARVLIDLTAGNVVLAKWRNIVRARSLDTRGPFLCTMGYDPKKSGGAAGLAYQSGRPLAPISDTTGAKGVGGYVVFELSGDRLLDAENESAGQAYSDKTYADITLSLGTDRPADVMARRMGPRVDVTGPKPLSGHAPWIGFTNKAGRIGVLPLALSDLFSSAVVHRLDIPEGVFNHHMLLYYSAEAPNQMDDVLSLMKLRAIEHRAGVALLAGNCREVLKTNRYKNIQRFKEVDGVFGLNAEFLGGTWSTAGASSLQGVPRRWFAQYRSLIR